MIINNSSEMKSALNRKLLLQISNVPGMKTIDEVVKKGRYFWHLNNY